MSVPDYIVALPVGAYNLKPNLDTFTRTGIDGAEVIMPFFGGDNYVGEVLAGKWTKVDGANIQAPISLIDGGTLKMSGYSSGAGVYANHDLRSTANMYLVDGLEVDFHVSLPALPPSQYYDFSYVFYLNSSNYIFFLIGAVSTNYYIHVYSVIDGSATVHVNAVGITNNEGTYRIKWRQKGFSQTNIYFHDGAGAVDEAADEVAGSPFDLKLQDVPVQIWVRHASTETVDRTVESDFMTVSYPDLNVKYELAESDLGKGDCKCFDTMGSASESDWQRVYDLDHVFVGDCVVQNGLIRFVITEGNYSGVYGYTYLAAAWVLFTWECFPILLSPDVNLPYPRQTKLVSITTERIAFRVKWCDSIVDNDDNYMVTEYEVKRGSYYTTFKTTKLHPLQLFQFVLHAAPSNQRWGYVGDADGTAVLGDYDLGLAAALQNTTMSDNITCTFDDDQEARIHFLTSNLKPITGLVTLDGRYIYIQYYAPNDIATLRMYLGVVPFSQIANLFKEAEDATYGGGADVVNLADDSGSSVRLNAQNEYVQWFLNPISDYLPNGRYIALIRMKDTNHVANDPHLFVFNYNDSTYLNEENGEVLRTLTADWLYYQLVFDVNDDDSGDSCAIGVRKNLATANTIYVDYFLIVPIGNGESWPQDVIHNAMRHLIRSRRITQK